MGGEPGAKTADAVSKTHTVETSRGLERGASAMRVRSQRRAPKLRASAELERGGGEGTQSAAAGSAPRPLVVAGAGLRHTRAATSAEVCREETRRVSFSPTGRIPAPS